MELEQCLSPSKIGHYNIIKKIGEGSYGDIYLCESCDTSISKYPFDLKINTPKQVAIKVPKTEKKIPEKKKR